MRLHLAGFYWGDCSLSNTLFRRDAGALSAYIIDVETGERHPSLSDGQRRLDLTIATENVAGDLEDLQAGGRLADGIDPIATALAIETTLRSGCGCELTGADEFDVNETFRIDQRLQRLHDLGFDAAELELYTTADGAQAAPDPASRRARLPRPTSEDPHRPGDRREPGPPPAQRHHQIPGRARTARPARRCPKPSRPRAGSTSDSSRPSTASRPTSSASWNPPSCTTRCSSTCGSCRRRAGFDVGLGEAVTSYVRDVLTQLPDEHRTVTKSDDAEWTLDDWAAEGWAVADDDAGDTTEDTAEGNAGSSQA